MKIFSSYNFFVLFALLVVLYIQGCSSTSLKPWHTVKLDEEFTEEKAEQVKNFEDYLRLENRLYKQLDEKTMRRVKPDQNTISTVSVPAVLPTRASGK